nr:MAG TPA: hypothetical protein [Caudoviricetes sp.]
MAETGGIVFVHLFETLHVGYSGVCRTRPPPHRWRVSFIRRAPAQPSVFVVVGVRGWWLLCGWLDVECRWFRAGWFCWFGGVSGFDDVADLVFGEFEDVGGFVDADALVVPVEDHVADSCRHHIRSAFNAWVMMRCSVRRLTRVRCHPIVSACSRCLLVWLVAVAVLIQRGPMWRSVAVQFHSCVFRVFIAWFFRLSVG